MSARDEQPVNLSGPKWLRRLQWVIGGALAVVALLLAGFILYRLLYESLLCCGARRPTCLSNMKQLGLAVALYVRDYDDRLPLANWQDLLVPYLEREKQRAPVIRGMPVSRRPVYEFFRCPQDTTPQTDSYACNRSLAGLNLDEFYQRASDTSRTVLLYEVEDGKIAFRHQGGTNILTVDFHARWYAPADIATLEWR